MTVKIVKPIKVSDATMFASDIPEPDTARGEVEWVPFEQKRFSEDFNPSTVGYSYVAAPILFHNGNYYILVRSGGFPNFNWAIVEVDSEFTVLSTNSIQVASNTPNNLGFSLEEATGRITLFFGDLQGGILQYARVSVNNIIPSPAFTDISSVITTVFPGGVSGGVIFSLHGCESEGSFFFVARKDNDFKVHKFSVSATEIASKVTNSIETIYPDGNGGVYGFLTSTPSATDTTVKISRFDFQLSESQIGTIKSTQAWIASSVDASFSGGIFIQTSVNTGTGSANAKSFDETTLLNIGHYKSGDRVILTSNHTVYQCLTDTFDNPTVGATGDATATWIKVGPTNRWAAFVDEISTPTVINKDSLARNREWTIKPGEKFNSVSVFGCYGLEKVVFQRYSSSDVLIQSVNVPLIDSDAELEWGLDPGSPAFIDTAFYDGFNYNDGDYLKVIIDAADGFEGGISLIAFGISRLQGDAVNNDLKRNYMDLSTYDYDEFGTIKVTKRPVVKLNTYSIYVTKDRVDVVDRFINSLAGEFNVWYASIGDGQSLITYGSYERSPTNITHSSYRNYIATVRSAV